MATHIKILYGAKLNQPAGSPYGWVPFVSVNDRTITDTYMPHPLDYGEAWRRAKTEAHEEMSRYRGDFTGQVSPY